MQILCENLSIGYGNMVLHHNINFSVNKGDYLCIIGENGESQHLCGHCWDCSHHWKEKLFLEMDLNRMKLVICHSRLLFRRISRHQSEKLFSQAARINVG